MRLREQLFAKLGPERLACDLGQSVLGCLMLVVLYEIASDEASVNDEAARDLLVPRSPIFFLSNSRM